MQCFAGRLKHMLASTSVCTWQCKTISVSKAQLSEIVSRRQHVSAHACACRTSDEDRAKDIEYLSSMKVVSLFSGVGGLDLGLQQVLSTASSFCASHCTVPSTMA